MAQETNPQPKDQDLIARIRDFQRVIEDPSASESSLLNILQRLQSQGYVPIDVLKATRIGKTLHDLAKQSPFPAVRTQALSLNAAWRAAFRNRDGGSVSCSNSPVPVPRSEDPQGPGPKGSSVSRPKAASQVNRARSDSVSPSPSSSSLSSSRPTKKSRKSTEHTHIGLSDLVSGWHQFNDKEKKKIHTHLRDGASKGLFPSRTGAKWEWQSSDSCLAAVQAHLAKHPMVKTRTTDEFTVDSESAEAVRVPTHIGLSDLVPEWHKLSDVDKSKIHTHLRDGAANGRFPSRVGSKWEWQRDDTCLRAVRAHLAKHPLAKSLISEGSSIVGASEEEEDDEGLMAAPLEVSRSVLDKYCQAPLVEKIPRVSKSEASIRRLVSSGSILDLKEYAFVAEVFRREDDSKHEVFKHQPKQEELRMRWSACGVTCSVCGNTLTRWIKVRCHARQGIVSHLRPEVFFAGKDECLWKLLGVDQGETRSQRLSRILHEALVGGDLSELRNLFSESPVTVLMEIRRRLEGGTRKHTSKSQQAGQSLGRSMHLGLSRRPQPSQQGRETVADKGKHSDSDDSWHGVFDDPREAESENGSPNSVGGSASSNVQATSRQESQSPQQKERARHRNPRKSLQLLLEFLQSSAPDLFRNATAGAEARMSMQGHSVSGKGLAAFDGAIKGLARSHGDGSSLTQQADEQMNQSSRSSSALAAPDIRQTMISALDMHFRKLGIQQATAGAPELRPSAPTRQTRVLATRPSASCHDCCNAPPGCVNSMCDFHCRNLWVKRYSAGDCMLKCACSQHRSFLMDPEGAWEQGGANQRLEATLAELGCWGFQESWCQWGPHGQNTLDYVQRVQKAIALRAAKQLHGRIWLQVHDGCSRLIHKYLEKWWEAELENVWRQCCQLDCDPDRYLGKP